MFPRQVTDFSDRVGSLTLLVGLTVGACQDHIVVGHTGTSRLGVGGVGGAGGTGGTGGTDGLGVGGAPEPAMPPGEPGLVGEYWNNLDFSGAPAFTRVDPNTEFLWSDSPAPGVSSQFSARWQGWLLPPTADTYRLSLESDDGSRLWLDGELLIDQWQGAPNFTELEVQLDPSQPPELRLELYSLGGSASLILRWQSSSLPLQTVTGDHLSVP